MRIITFNPSLKHFIDKSLKKGVKISIKVGRDKKTYQNYDKRLCRLFTDVSTDMLRDAECCVADFPEEQVGFIVFQEDGTIEEYFINKCTNKI